MDGIWACWTKQYGKEILQSTLNGRIATMGCADITTTHGISKYPRMSVSVGTTQRNECNPMSRMAARVERMRGAVHVEIVVVVHASTPSGSQGYSTCCYREGGASASSGHMDGSGLGRGAWPTTKESLTIRPAGGTHGTAHTSHQHVKRLLKALENLLLATRVDWTWS